MIGYSLKGERMSEDLTRKLLRSDSNKLDLILTYVQSLDGRIEKLEQTMEALMLEFNSSVRQIDRDQIVINDVVRKMQLDFIGIEERLHRLEVDSKRSNSST